jgi:transcription elongation GreA/GreB family factor
MLRFKADVVQALRAALAADLEGVERMASLARDEATSSETKAEGKYDTRATEAAYLARGQGARILELRSLNTWYEFNDRALPVDESTVRLGALVELQADKREWVFIAPVGGGSVQVEERLVRAISFSSPLGQALVELEEGESAEVETPRGLVEVEVISVV